VTFIPRWACSSALALNLIDCDSCECVKTCNSDGFEESAVVDVHDYDKFGIESQESGKFVKVKKSGERWNFD
jgi:hypothetical protein